MKKILQSWINITNGTIFNIMASSFQNHIKSKIFTSLMRKLIMVKLSTFKLRCLLNKKSQHGIGVKLKALNGNKVISTKIISKNSSYKDLKNLALTSFKTLTSQMSSNRWKKQKKKRKMQQCSKNKSLKNKRPNYLKIIHLLLLMGIFKK